MHRWRLKVDMSHNDHEQAPDRHAAHQTHGSHDRHAGHSVAMFRDKFWLSLALTIPVVFWSTDVQHWLGYTAPSFPGSKFIPAILGTVIFVYGGLVFIQGAWSELSDPKPGMMTLISLAIVVAFGTSLAATFGLFEIDVWWELASLIAIMVLGHWLEMRAISQARGALNALAALLPDTAEGSVAKTIAEDRRTGINWIRSPLCGGIEKSGNEDRLSSDIASADLSNLPLPDHRHRFETWQCSSGGSEPAEAEPRSDQTLDAPMILLDNIIQILALPETRTAPELAVSLHLRDRPWIGGVLVDREGARIDGARLRERLAEEPLRGSRIAPCSQQEVDRLPAAVHRPIEIHPTSLHLDIGLVHPPRSRSISSRSR